ncbi:MAG: molybdopterin-dependent oxidoreductase [Desulfobacteraceae bacterium]|nr:MAG: molybdopterin-dependent oxidoreductase [Desulfobacteraceae bacterium]
MNKVPTVCPRDCYDTCFMVAGVDDDERVLSVKGDGENPVTRGFTCPRGAKDAEHAYVNRVLFPQLRKGPKPRRDFEKSSWEETLDLVANRLQGVIDTWGPERVLFLDYAGNMGLLASKFPQRLWNAIKATRTDHGICSKSGHAGLSLHYGLGYGIQPEELVEKNLIIYWGFNASVSSPHMWALSLKAKREMSSRIIVVDPRRTDTARGADLWICPKPGSDVALAYGIARYLIKKGLIDFDFIEERTYGFEAYEKEVMKWNPQLVAETTGVDWAMIEELGAAYGELSPSATMMGIGFQKSIQGAEAVRAISLLPALIGQHRGFFYGNGSGYFIDKSYLTGTEFIDESPRIVSQVGLVDYVRRGDFKFIYISCMNPALTLPNQRAFRDGLSRNDVFVVLHDTHWTETADFANVVLPAQTHLEKEDIVLPWSHWHIRRSNRVVDPLGESRHEIDIMTELAKRIELEDEWLFEDPWKAVEQSIKNAIEPGTFKELLEGKTVRLRYKERFEYLTPTGRLEFFSNAAEADGYNPLPQYIPFEMKEGEYILLNSSIPKYSHTQFQDVYGPIPAIVWINTSDAQSIGVHDDDMVILYNGLGETEARVVVTGDVPAGVLWSPKQFVGHDGNPQNCLTKSCPQRVGGGSVFNSTIVRVTRHELDP